MKIIFFCLFSFGCATFSDAPTTSSSETLIQTEAPTCNGYVSKANCDDGDTTLFAGLLCLSGVDIGCETVKDSQASDGRFWRSPRRNPNNIGKDNSFSRDMSLGVLAYLIKTKDTEAANRWMNWIEKNRPCLFKIGRSCKYRGLHRLCKDDRDGRCTITPTIFQMMYFTWKYLGLDPTKTMLLYKSTPLLSPANKGYQIHLYAVEEFLKQKMNIGERKAVENIIAKEPTNPFYMYLDQGKTEEVINRYTELCSQSGDRKLQWAWERLASEKAWEDSMIWDCVFMTNL